MHHILVVHLLNLILFSQPAAVFSQTASSSLYGTVSDSNGILIPRAKVLATLRGPISTGSPRLFETETNDEGKFSLRNLPSAVYEVRVSFAGSESKAEEIVFVPKGETVEIAIQFGRGCDGIAGGAGVVNDVDKAEVVRLTLAQAISPKLGLLEQEQRDKGVILSTRNIRPEWIKGVQGITIKLMSQSQIQRKADRERDFLHMSFPEVRVKGTCIVVVVANSWAVGKRSRVLYMSGGGYKYEYRKESGKWMGRFVSGWVS